MESMWSPGYKSKGESMLKNMVWTRCGLHVDSTWTVQALLHLVLILCGLCLESTWSPWSPRGVRLDTWLSVKYWAYHKSPFLADLVGLARAGSFGNLTDIEYVSGIDNRYSYLCIHVWNGLACFSSERTRSGTLGTYSSPYTLPMLCFSFK